jgi:hypothetical protein
MRISKWISADFQNENLRTLILVLATWLLFFFEPLTGKSYTSWDTHDLGFVNFLYFSDSLRGGFFPLWSHFIQSGTFFPSFNNIGLYTPFQLFFIVLSWMINPLYAYELMIQAVVLIGGVGANFLARTFANDRLIALFGAISFATLVLVPIVGQFGFLISLSSFPWLIYGCAKIINGGDGLKRYAIIGVFGALYLASGYLWMNLMHLVIAAFFSLILIIRKYLEANLLEKRFILLRLLNLTVFFGVIIFIYGSLQLPGYFSMQFNYGLLSGDYVSLEPRLRSLSANGQYHSYGTIYKAIIAAIDPRIYVNEESWLAELPRWSLGASWTLAIFFLVIPKKNLSWQQIFWLMLMFIALFYSSGKGNFLGNWIRDIPIVNANRWWHIGTSYVIISLLFFVVSSIAPLRELEPNSKSHTLRFFIVGSASIGLLAYFKSPVSQFALVLLSLILIWLIFIEKRQSRLEILLALLIGITVFSSVSIPYSIPSVRTYLSNVENNSHSQQISEREKKVTIELNERRLNKQNDYIYNDYQWILKKIPFSHGYNNLGNPHYWYVKNNLFLEKLVVVTQDVRVQMDYYRNDFVSDNDFVKALMIDVQSDMSRPTIESKYFQGITADQNFKWNLVDLKIEPNKASMLINTNAAAYLIFNNVNHPGWNVYVNGEQAKLIKTNHIFQGVFLEGAGSYKVVFKFQPFLTIAIIMFPYIVLVGLIWSLRREHKKFRKV